MSRHRHIRNATPLTRRDLLRTLAAGCLGLSLPQWLPAADPPLPPDDPPRLRRPTARHLITIFCSGGMSHLDTFDPKTGRDELGPVADIPSAVDGIRLSSHLPRLAAELADCVVLRSLTSTQGAHEPGRYYLHTGYQQRGLTPHPGLAAWLLHAGGRRHPDLPGSVLIGNDPGHPGAGFLEPALAPLPMGRADQGLPGSRVPAGVSPQRLEAREALARDLASPFVERHAQAPVRAWRDYYEEAARLLASPDLAAFDLSNEPQAVREAYGDHPFAHGCCLARRLVEHGVRSVEVQLGGWDDHADLMDDLPERCAVLDRAVAELIADLRRRGLLSETLVMVCSEFGRTPLWNERNGRDHHPQAFSALLAGGGLHGGRVWGETDERGEWVVEQAMSVPDLHATLAWGLGLPVGTVVHAADGRPFAIGAGGTPAYDLFR